MRISYSALDTYRTCPLKYKFQEIDKIRTPKNFDLIFGSAIHSSLKFMFERNPLYPTANQVVDHFRNQWDANKGVITLPNGNALTAEQEDFFYKDGITILERFYKHNQPWNFSTVELESRFGVEIRDDKTGEAHILSGTMDRVDKDHETGFYEIIDYKTSKKMSGKQQVDGDLQLSIYHLALIKKWPQVNPNNIKLSLYFVRHGEKVTTSRNNKQLEETKNYVVSTIKEINERVAGNYDFPPTPCPLCDWCGYKQMCPMYKHLYLKEYESKKIKNQEELNLALREYFQLKQENSTNNKRLAELKITIGMFMDENKVERVFGDEGYITRKSKDNFSYKMEEIKPLLQKINKWEEILAPDKDLLEKVMSFLPDEIQEKIFGLRSFKKVTTFTASKKKGGDNDSEDE